MLGLLPFVRGLPGLLFLFHRLPSLLHIHNIIYGRFPEPELHRTFGLDFIAPVDCPVIDKHARFAVKVKSFNAHKRQFHTIGGTQCVSIPVQYVDGIQVVRPLRRRPDRLHRGLGHVGVNRFHAQPGLHRESARIRRDGETRVADGCCLLKGDRRW